MKLSLLSICVILLAFTSQAEVEKRIAYGFMKTESVRNNKFQKTEAQFVFNIKGLKQADKNAEIIYSINGVEVKTKLSEGSFSLMTVPGKHIFQIWISPEYTEMYSDSLEITGGYMDTYNVYIQRASIEVIMDKPVIYLYPETEMNVSVKMDVKGDLTFTYPIYNDGWDVFAHPDGTIDHNGKSFNYLFWEAKHEMSPSQFDQSNGFVVKRDDLLAFIEARLDEAQFTSKEMADFITYWIPRMLSHEKLFIQFVQNDQCRQFSTLDIEPKPETVARFYMNWSALTEDISPKPQIIQPIERKGFTVLEWGGQEINQPRI